MTLGDVKHLRAWLQRNEDTKTYKEDESDCADLSSRELARLALSSPAQL